MSESRYTHDPTPSEIILLYGSNFAGKKRPILIALVILMFFCLSAYLIFFGLMEINAAWSSRNWPSADGEIITSEVSFDGEFYHADIFYEFVVGHSKFSGSKVSFGGDLRTDSEQIHQDIIDKYPKGSDVVVYYDPALPTNSVLEKGYSFWIFFWLGIGLIFFLATGYMLRFYLPLVFQ